MKKSLYILLSVVSVTLLYSCNLNGQQLREIIIIEKTVDKDGNEISRKTIKKSGDISDDEIQELTEDDGRGINSGKRSQDLFRKEGELLPFGQYFGKDSNKPRLGITTTTQNNTVEVVSVARNSAAEEAEIQVGDKIIAIDDIIIGNNQDIIDIIERKRVGEKVTILLLRDGIELTKEASLKTNRATNLFFDNLPELGIDEHFGQMDLEEIFGSFKNLFGDTFKEFGDYDFSEDFPLNKNDRDSSPGTARSPNQRPSLGAYVEMTADGLEIVEIMSNSSAQYGGLIPGDIILEAEGVEIKSVDTITDIIQAKKVGETLTLKIKQKDKIKDVSITLRASI